MSLPPPGVKRRGRIFAVCARCGRERTINARGLCASCYGVEHKAGRLLNYSLNWEYKTREVGNA